MTEELRVWQLIYSYNIYTCDSASPTIVKKRYYLPARTGEEAKTKADKLFSEAEDIKPYVKRRQITKQGYLSSCRDRRKLLAGKEADLGSGCYATELEIICRPYLQTVARPKLSADAEKFSLEARLAEDGECIEYFAVPKK